MNNQEKSQVAHACERMKADLAAIETSVRALPQDWLRWRPSDDVWSILDNLSHLEEFLPYWTGQLLCIVTRPIDPQPWGRTHMDPDRLAAVSRTDERELDELLASVRGRLEETCRRLAAVTNEDLAIRALSRNPRWGVKPASFILEDLLQQHLAKHRQQISRNIIQLETLSTPNQGECN